MALNTSLDAALKGVAPLVTIMFEMVLPDHTIRVMDGSGEIPFGGETFTGSDPTYGVLNAIEDISEQVGTEAPRVRFSFLPASLTALANITAPDKQGSEVTVWLAAINPATGLLIGQPEVLFVGELDSAEIDYDPKSTVITFDVASAWERLFDANEGNRLNNAFHQSVWPGERGFEFVTVVQRQEPWGYSGPRPAVVSDVISGQPGQPGQGGYGGPASRWRDYERTT